MRPADGFAVMPPEPGHIHELGVGVEKLSDRVGVALVPGLGEGRGEILRALDGSFRHTEDFTSRLSGSKGKNPNLVRVQLRTRVFKANCCDDVS